MRFSLFIFTLFGSAALLFAQLNTPQPSPLGKITQVVGVTEVSIEYSRPGIKGREIFGELVPYGKIWRTGANASTKIKFDTEVKLEGHAVPAGEYSLYTQPGEKEWKIIINKNLNAGQNPDPAEDLVSFKVKSRLVPLPVERFTIEIADMTDNSANIILKWAQTQVSFMLETDSDKMVMAEIKKFVESDTSKDSGLYYSAARYYFEHDKGLDEALNLINKSLEINDQPFWVLRLKSQILAAKNDYEEAIVFAKRSMVSAQKAGNDQYVKMNEESIEEWQQKL